MELNSLSVTCRHSGSSLRINIKNIDYKRSDTSSHLTTLRMAENNPDGDRVRTFSY